MKQLKSSWIIMGFAIISNYVNSQNTFPASGNVGIGISTPTTPLQVKVAATGLTGENIAKFEVSDAGNAFIKIINGTSANGSFYPMLDATSSVPIGNTQLPSLVIRANGLMDIGPNPLMVFRSAINSGVAAVRPLFQWQQGDGTPKMTMNKAGNIGINTTTPTERLEVSGNIRLNSNQIYFKFGDNSHGLGYFNSNFATTGAYLNKTINGPVLYGFSGGALGTNQAGVKNIALSWLANGNVGIGTATPIQPLDINGSISVTGGIQKGGTTALAITDLGLYAQDASWMRFVTTKQPIRFYTDGGTGSMAYMTIEPTGNVGIGTNNPGGRLAIEHSYDNSASPRANQIYLTDPTNSNLKGYIGMNRNSGAGTNKEYFGIEAVAEGVHWMNIALAAEGGNVGVGNTNPVARLDVEGNARIASLATGGLVQADANGILSTIALSSSGIGLWNTNGTNIFPANTSVGVAIGKNTINPIMKLDVEGNIAINNNDLYLRDHYHGLGWYGTGKPFISTTTENIDGPVLYGYNGGALGSKYFGSTTDVETIALRWYSNGQVQIGDKKITAAPHNNFKLAVDGKIVATEIYVTLTGWADYVFAKDYKLSPLAEVEKYIANNKHLPDVPSEKEIMENGSNLGQTDVILLKKIEELTLYMIEQNKKVNELSTTVQAQQEQIQTMQNK